MQIQLKFVKFVVQKYSLRAILFLCTIVIASFLELSLVSFFYFLTNILLGSNDVTHSILGVEVKFENFNIWFLFVTILATIARIGIIIFQANNMAIISNGLVQLIYTKVISMPLTKFRKKSDAEVISLLTTKIQHCADNILVQVSQIISAITISLGIIIALLIIDTKTTILVFVILVVTYFFIMKFSKSKLKVASKDLSVAHDKKNRQILNTLHNIEGIMAYGEYKANIDEITSTDAILRNSQKLISIFGTSPRFLIEGIIIILAALPLLYFTSEYNLSTTDIAFIGAFMVGAIRLLPLINQVYAGLNSVRGSEFVAYDVMKVITSIVSKDISNITNQGSDDLIIESKNLSIKLGAIELRYPDFSIHAGESLAIVGQSGSGKSKLLHTILGLIEINGGNLTNTCFDQKHQRNIGVGYASQQPVIVSNYISEIVATGAEFNQLKVDKILDMMSLKNELSDRKSIGDWGTLLSGGQLQRLALCNALYRSSRLLVLDEPTSALSLKMSHSIIKKIIGYCNDNKISIVCVTHDLKIADMFDKRIEIL
jgi:ATP-binding cassette, subfamily B, bacterial PglK